VIGLVWPVLACGQPQLEAPLGVAQTEVHAALESKHVGVDEPLVLTLTVSWADGWTPGLGSQLPELEGLGSTLVDAHSLDGERAAAVQVWELRGAPGSHVVPPLAITFTDSDGATRTLQSAALYADIGADGPSSDLAPMALAPVPEPLPVWPFALAGLWVVAAGAGLWWHRRRLDAAPAPPPRPPDELALLAWQALQADTSLDDHARAVGLSALFRRYLEAVLPVAATTATSREILDALDLAQSLQVRTRRLLTATDLIKFARKGGGDPLFTELDADLRAVIAATRPVPAQDTLAAPT